MYSSSFLHVVCYASCEVVTCHIVCYVVSCISFAAVTDLAVTKLTLVGDATDIDISVTEVLRINLKVALVSGSGWPTNDLLKPLFHFKFLLSSKYRHLRCLSHKFTDDIILLLAAYRQHNYCLSSGNTELVGNWHVRNTFIISGAKNFHHNL